MTCYAGAGYPERPRWFGYRGRRLEVVEVERRQRTPNEVRFLVRAADGGRFWLAYDQGEDAWRVRPIRRAQEPGQEGGNAL